MKTVIKLLSLTLITLLLNPQTTTAQCHLDDWTALKALYNSTDGDNWTNRTGWGTVLGDTPASNCDLSLLYGVSLDAQGSVTCLDFDGDENCNFDYLDGNNLNGSIPPELGNLSNLEYLSLKENELSGSIPPGLENLSNLRYLYLNGNELSGSIPSELGNLSNLQELRLSQNQLSGSIPSELDNLSNLQFLSFGNNQLSGSIPPEFGNLSNLRFLYLYNNELSGSIPSELGNLSNLEILNLCCNGLIGSIPLELGNLNNLTYFSLYTNELSGSIPPELGNLSNLRFLRLYKNQLSGSIPAELGNLSNLTDLKLYTNELSGSIPPEFGNLSNLQELWLFTNELSGSIPPELGNLSNLEILYLNSNQLGGSIPPELGNLSNLTDLRLYTNELSGSIPPELENLSNLEYLSFGNNQLSSSIPPELGNLSNLTDLRLYTNELSGSIPPELGNLNKLTMLTINDNDLSGCYNENLAILCTQLNNPNFDGNPEMSYGNNFEATWEDFCATSAGVCIVDECEDDCETNVYPGDLNHDGIVNNQDVSLSGLFQYQSGIARAPQHQSIVWDAYPAQDWGIVNNQDKDIKHHDCNGDGTIDEADQQAVEDNMGLMWETPNPIDPPDESDYQVMLQPTDQIYDGNLVMNVSLERRAGGNLTLQGGHFTVDYSDIEGNFSFVGLNFEPISWLGTPNNNLWYESTHLESDKKIEVGFTKTNNANSVGSGIVGQLILEYDNSLARQAGASNISYNFEVNAIGVHQNNGDFIPIEDQQLEIIIDSDICYSNLIIDEEAPFQNLYKSTNTITTNDFVIIGADQKVELNANQVRINSGFSVKAGADFKVRSGGCN